MGCTYCPSEVPLTSEHYKPFSVKAVSSVGRHGRSRNSQMRTDASGVDLGYILHFASDSNWSQQTNIHSATGPNSNHVVVCLVQGPSTLKVSKTGHACASRTGRLELNRAKAMKSD